MCTVTLTSYREGFILTSNRDEAPGRHTLAPELYKEADVAMVYPRDEVAGGTWLGVSARKRVICLLNGEFERHRRQPPYRQSRGLVVKDFLAAPNWTEALQEYNFEGIEPFTFIVADWAGGLHFSEVVWDGRKIHSQNLPLKPQIWSSSPLYTAEMKEQRRAWFEEFLRQEQLNARTLLDFHRTAGTGDKNVDVIMDRGFVKTKSLSQVILSDEGIRFYYQDLSTGEDVERHFPESLQPNSGQKAR